MLLLDASLHRWLENRGPQLTLLGFLDDATGKVLVAEFFPTEDARGYFRLLQRLLRRFGVPISFYGDRHSVFVRNDDHWSVEEQLAGRQQPTQFGRALEQLGITYIAATGITAYLENKCTLEAARHIANHESLRTPSSTIEGGMRFRSTK